MPILFPYNALATGQTKPGEPLPEAMEMETSDEEDILLELHQSPREPSPGSSRPRQMARLDGASACPRQGCPQSDDSGSFTETGPVLERHCDQEGLIQELHVSELTPFEQEEARKQKKQRKKAKRKKIRKRLWRAVRTTWKYIKRGFSGYAPTPGIINSFTWGVNLPQELFKNPPTRH